MSNPLVNELNPVRERISLSQKIDENGKRLIGVYACSFCYARKNQCFYDKAILAERCGRCHRTNRDCVMPDEEEIQRRIQIDVNEDSRWRAGEVTEKGLPRPLHPAGASNSESGVSTPTTRARRESTFLVLNEPPSYLYTERTGSFSTNSITAANLQVPKETTSISRPEENTQEKGVERTRNIVVRGQKVDVPTARMNYYTQYPPVHSAGPHYPYFN